MSSAIVRNATIGDAEPIVAIYNHYITHSIATFVEDVLPASEMARLIDATLAESMPWLVAEGDGVMLGYAYATNWKARRAYRFTAEATVYLGPEESGKGIGSLLYSKLMSELQERGFHAALGGISLPNDGSVALHEKLGFVKVAHFKEAGFKFGKWIDVGYWEKIL